ncbi:hypothetical protein R3I94_004137 [Phoxinus phoxinus]
MKGASSSAGWRGWRRRRPAFLPRVISRSVNCQSSWEQSKRGKEEKDDSSRLRTLRLNLSRLLVSFSSSEHVDCSSDVIRFWNTHHIKQFL